MLLFITEGDKTVGEADPRVHCSPSCVSDPISADRYRLAELSLEENSIQFYFCGAFYGRLSQRCFTDSQKGPKLAKTQVKKTPQ